VQFEKYNTYVTSYNIGVERRRTATATGLYDSFCHIFPFYTVSHYIYLSEKKFKRRGTRRQLPPRAWT